MLRNKTTYKNVLNYHYRWIRLFLIFTGKDKIIMMMIMIMILISYANNQLKFQSFYDQLARHYVVNWPAF
mgnify:CR=1 FL=1